jgi:predicted N-acetyltransferase YhbS
MNFAIKEANEEDAPNIHQLLLKAFKKYQDFYTKEGFEDTVLSGNKAKKRVRNMNVYVAIDNEGRIVGTIGWQKVNKDEAGFKKTGKTDDFFGRTAYEFAKKLYS